jgi:carboxymethylenebutenolidase
MTRPTTDRPAVTQAMINLYDEFTHVTLDRRNFMRRLATLAGGTAAALAVDPLLEANAARAAIVADDDARIRGADVTYPGDGGAVSGYLVRPSAAGKRPAVVVILENRGLNPHIRDVARRAAVAGFVALAPDLLSPAGGTPADPDKAREMIGALDMNRAIANAVAAVAFLKGHAETTGKVGAVGFCWGGGMVNLLAINASDLAAGVAFYGRVPPADQVARIRGRMLLHYAGLDERINAGIPEYRKALEDAKVDHAVHMYDGVNHAFHNDTAEARYDKAAAELAWRRTVEFLEAALGA